MTVSVQLPVAGIVAPVSVTDPAPLDALKVPPQVELTAGTDATTNPAGKVFVKPALVAALVAELLSTKVSVETPPWAMVAGAKLLLIEGLAATVSVALPVLPAPPLPDATVPVTLL